MPILTTMLPNLGIDSGFCCTDFSSSKMNTINMNVFGSNVNPALLNQSSIVRPLLFTEMNPMETFMPSMSSIPGKKRVAKSDLALLNMLFASNPKPNTETRMHIANRIGVSERCIQVWFQNRRAKERKDKGKTSPTNETKAPNTIEMPMPITNSFKMPIPRLSSNRSVTPHMDPYLNLCGNVFLTSEITSMKRSLPSPDLVETMNKKKFTF